MFNLNLIDSITYRKLTFYSTLQNKTLVKYANFKDQLSVNMDNKKQQQNLIDKQKRNQIWFHSI